jgi:Flp pilus assembly protein TadG
VLVEFALSIFIYVTLLMGAIDLARWLFAVVSIGEATRAAARAAVVCDLNDTAIQQHMSAGLVSAVGGTVTVSYLPSGCYAHASAGTPVCTGLTVTTSNYQVPRVSWFMPTMSLPTATTYLPRESMTSASNARCD